MSIDFEALRRRIIEASADGISPLKVFEEMGIDPGDPAVLQEITSLTGIDFNQFMSQDQGGAKDILDTLLSNVNPEDMKQLSQLLDGLTSGEEGIPPVPAEVGEMLKKMRE